MWAVDARVPTNVRQEKLQERLEQRGVGLGRFGERYERGRKFWYIRRNHYPVVLGVRGALAAHHALDYQHEKRQQTRQ